MAVPPNPWWTSIISSSVLISTGVAVPAAFPGIRFSSSSRRVTSATTLLCGTIAALDSSDPRFREISRVPSGERGSPAYHGLDPPPQKKISQLDNSRQYLLQQLHDDDGQNDLQPAFIQGDAIHSKPTVVAHVHGMPLMHSLSSPVSHQFSCMEWLRLEGFWEETATGWS